MTLNKVFETYNNLILTINYETKISTNLLSILIVMVYTNTYFIQLIYILYLSKSFKIRYNKYVSEINVKNVFLILILLNTS